MLCAASLTWILGCSGKVASEAVLTGVGSPVARSGERLANLFGGSRPVSANARAKDGAMSAHMVLSDEWLDSRPSATGDANWRCLAEALYFEARG